MRPLSFTSSSASPIEPVLGIVLAHSGLSPEKYLRATLFPTRHHGWLIHISERCEIQLHRKNAEIAEDEVDASDIAAIRYAEDLALLICLAAFTIICRIC